MIKTKNENKFRADQLLDTGLNNEIKQTSALDLLNRNKALGFKKLVFKKKWLKIEKLSRIKNGFKIQFYICMQS